MNLHAAMPRISRMPACAVLVFAAGMASLFGMTSGVTPVLLKPMEGAAVSVLPSDASVRGDITGIAFKDVAEKPTFAKLAGTRAVLSFLRPITLRKIALPRIGWADWALPKTARVSVNGGPATEVTLSAPRISPGKYLPAGALEMDVVDFGKEMEVSEISVEITGAGAERGDNLHGTIRVAIPAPPPTLFGLTASDAVPPTAVGVTFEVECGAPVNEPLFIASARQFRAARALTAPLPSFPQGKSKYTVFWFIGEVHVFPSKLV